MWRGENLWNYYKAETDVEAGKKTLWYVYIILIGAYAINMDLFIKEKLHVGCFFLKIKLLERRNWLRTCEKWTFLPWKIWVLAIGISLYLSHSWFLSFVWLMRECSTYTRDSGSSLRKCIEAISRVTWHYVLPKLWAALEPLLTFTTFPYRIYFANV